MLLVLWSCGSERSCDTAGCDEDHWRGTARLDDFGWGCEASTWWYAVYTLGLTGSATVDIRESGSDPLSEQHSLEERAADPYGYWDEWYVELAIVPRDDNYAPGSETRFGCGDENGLTFKVAVTDTEGDPLPCKAYGADPSVFSECEAAK